MHYILSVVANLIWKLSPEFEGLLQLEKRTIFPLSLLQNNMKVQKHKCYYMKNKQLLTLKAFNRRNVQR